MKSSVEKLSIIIIIQIYDQNDTRNTEEAAVQESQILKGQEKYCAFSLHCCSLINLVVY